MHSFKVSNQAYAEFRTALIWNVNYHRVVWNLNFEIYEAVISAYLCYEHGLRYEEEAAPAWNFPDTASPRKNFAVNAHLCVMAHPGELQEVADIDGRDCFSHIRNF